MRKTPGPVPGTTAIPVFAAVEVLEESQVSDYNFVASSSSRAVKPVPPRWDLDAWSRWGDKDTVGDTQQGAFPSLDFGHWLNSTREIWEQGDTWKWEKSWAVTHHDPESLGTG